MAVTADLLLAVSPTPSSPRIRISNTNTKFPAREFSLPPVIDASELEWSNYFKSGLKGALQLLEKKGIKAETGMDILVDGCVPSGGGLSSSAALCCASALASLYANGLKDVSKTDLVNLAVVSERFVGVNAGGMDQSASVFGKKNHALYITFTPSLTATPFEFPVTNPPLKFLIANSLVGADKHLTAPVNYNLRVVETTLAAEWLAKDAGLYPLPKDESPLNASLRTFQDLYYSQPSHDGAVAASHTPRFAEQLSELLTLAQKTFTKKEGYTAEEIASHLGISVEQLTERYMTKFPVQATHFSLLPRSEHVLTEALRVLNFRTTLTKGLSDSELLPALGELLNESQASCRDRFNCSCPELDEICTIARKAGAYGSRLTGAGWGGCSVHLVDGENVAKVMEALDKEYYSKFEKVPADKMVVSEPGMGSVVWLGGSL